MRKATKPAKLKDYQKMVVAASEVVMRNRGNQWRTRSPEYVLMEFPYFIKFREGFPKGPLVEKSPTTNTYKINAVRLLDWLYASGFSTYDTKMLVKQTSTYERFEARIDSMFEII
jgi:hypothetical protein